MCGKWKCVMLSVITCPYIVPCCVCVCIYICVCGSDSVCVGDDLWTSWYSHGSTSGARGPWHGRPALALGGQWQHDVIRSPWYAEVRMPTKRTQRLHVCWGALFGNRRGSGEGRKKEDIPWISKKQRFIEVNCRLNIPWSTIGEERATKRPSKLTEVRPKFFQWAKWIEGSLLFGVVERSQVFLHLSVTIKKLMGCWKVTLLRRAKGWAPGRREGGLAPPKNLLFYVFLRLPACDYDPWTWLCAVEVVKWGKDYNVSSPAALRRQAQSAGRSMKFMSSDSVFYLGRGQPGKQCRWASHSLTFRAVGSKFVPPFWAAGCPASGCSQVNDSGSVLVPGVTRMSGCPAGGLLLLWLEVPGSRWWSDMNGLYPS